MKSRPGMVVMVALCGAVVAFGQGPPSRALRDEWGTNYFREVRGQYRDLRPMFHWLAGGAGAPKTNPMTAWQALPKLEVGGMDRGGAIFFDGGRAFYVTNFPTTGVVDGQRVSVIARPMGTHTYTSANGVRRTIPLLDHGVPVPPRRSP